MVPLTDKLELAMEKTVIIRFNTETATMFLRADIKALYESGSQFDLCDILKRETSKYTSLATLSLGDIIISLDTNGDEDDMFAEYWVHRKDSYGTFEACYVISDCEYELPDSMEELFSSMLCMAIDENGTIETCPKAV